MKENLFVPFPYLDLLHKKCYLKQETLIHETYIGGSLFSVSHAGTSATSFLVSSCLLLSFSISPFGFSSGFFGDTPASGFGFNHEGAAAAESDFGGLAAGVGRDGFGLMRRGGSDLGLVGASSSSRGVMMVFFSTSGDLPVF